MCVFGLISETSHAGSNMPIYGFSLIHWFYYIDQPHNPSFPKGLVKTESNFIIKSLETDHFSVDWCLSFFDFLRPDLSPWGYRNVLSGCIAPPYSKEAELGGSDQKVSPSAGKNAGILLVPCRAWKWVYSWAWSCSLCERGTFFSTWIISRELCGFLLVFD